MQPQDILNFIQSRRSIGNLIAPAPNRAQIEQAIATAITAPDHKNLEPWRFIVFEGDSMNALGQALHASALEQGETDEKTLNKALNMPNRAPMIITCVTDYKTHEKVPQSEQLLSCGAAVQNLLLALQALGFATVWRSGNLSFANAIKDFLGVTGDNEVVGFIYVGTAGTEFPPRKPMDVNKFIEFR